VSDEEGFRPLKRGKRDGSDVVRENGSYLVDEDGRPTGFLKRAPAVRARGRSPTVPRLKTYLVFGGVFSLALALSGNLLGAVSVAISTLVVAAVAKARR
jgi:hypothetical protein